MYRLTRMAQICVLSALAVVLASLALPGARSQAVEPIQIMLVDSTVAFQTDEPAVYYDPTENLVVTPAEAAVSCSPEADDFAYGATKVSCTATLGGQSQTREFYVIVYRGSETEVELRDITQDPMPARPAGMVTYNIEFRPTLNVTAGKVVLTGTLPSQVRFISADPKCRIDPPKLTCTFFSVSAPTSFKVKVQINPGVSGSFEFPWALEVQNSQADMRSDNNSFIARTQIVPVSAPFQVFMPLLMKP